MPYNLYMRKNVVVDVPQNASVSYTLFAQGLKISIPVETEDGEFLRFEFLGGTAVVLFYTFGEFRRAYIVTGWQDGDGERIFLPGIRSPLFPILKARGRRIDDLKRTLRHLMKNDEFLPFKMPVEFWMRLSVAIQCRKAGRICVMWMFNEFKRRCGK